MVFRFSDAVFYLVSASLLVVLLVSNLVLLYLFGSQVRKALTHFNVTAHHEPIAEQIVEVENAGH